jgi:predicted chitinase
MWEEEKKRIEKLRWWDEVAGKHGFPTDIKVWHVHPLGMVENFAKAFTRRINLMRRHLQAIFIQANSPDKIAAIDTIVSDINLNYEKYKLDTPLRLSHFFAQLRQEAGADLRLIESLDYAVGTSTMVNGNMVHTGLKKAFLYFRHHPDEAELYGRKPGQAANQDAIADRAYSNVYRPAGGPTDLGNGDVASRDGSRFKGRGLKQTTGRYNYTDFNNRYQSIFDEPSPDFVANPELLAQPRYALHSGVFFWLRHKLYERADTGATDAVVNSITSKVNIYTPPESYEARRNHFKNIWDAQLFNDVFDD